MRCSRFLNLRQTHKGNKEQATYYTDKLNTHSSSKRYIQAVNASIIQFTSNQGTHTYTSLNLSQNVSMRNKNLILVVIIFQLWFLSSNGLAARQLGSRAIWLKLWWFCGRVVSRLYAATSWPHNGNLYHTVAG